jgi:hypothetical protein
MNFSEIYSKYSKLYLEQQPGENVGQDAAAPDPSAASQPEPQGTTQQVNIPPEGYVNLVRMIAKALVMNIPAGEIDTLLSGQEITQENAFEIQDGLKRVIKDNEVKNDNPERLQNPNFKRFEDSINEGNFMQKYEVLLNKMKKRSPYIK